MTQAKGFPYPEGRPAVGGGRRKGTKKQRRGAPPMPRIPKFRPDLPPGSDPFGKSGPRKPPTPKAPGVPTDPYAGVKSQLGSIYDPVLGQYAQLIKTRQDESAAQAKAKQDAFRAFAEWYGAHGPQQIQGIYDTAAGNQTAFAKGFSSAYTSAMRELAAKSNQQIAIAGGPAEQQIHVGPESGGDAIYGMGGAIPGNMLNQQGAAFAAAAALQPPAIFAEGQRQAGEITTAANKDIEALRLEETKLRSEYAAAVQEQIDKLRIEGQKAKAKKLENLVKRADAKTKQYGTIWVVKNGRLVDTKRPSYQAQKDADSSAYKWKTLDWRVKQDILKNKQAATRIWQAQKRLGLTAQNQSFNQWYKQQTLAQADARLAQGETRILQGWARIQAAAKGKGGQIIDPDTGRPISDAEVNSYAKDTREAIASLMRPTTEKVDGKTVRHPAYKPFQVLQYLHESGVPFVIWAPIAARRFKINPNANPSKLSYSAVLRLASFWGYKPTGAWRQENIRPEAEAFIRQAQGKGNAALSGGGQTGYLASLWVQAGGDPAVANIAAAIAMGESGGRNDARLVSSVEDSRGLWQINTRAHPWAKNLNNPLANAKAAVRVWKQSGKSFNPWSVYTSGKYKQYLNEDRFVSGGDMYYRPGQGRIIGEPYAGTHTLGNWESDNAVDVALAYGSPIYAVADGYIGPQFGSLGSSGRFQGFRLHLATNGNEFFYGHLSRYARGIRPGAYVRRGQIIGYSGAANGVNHLHFGMMNGDPRSLYGGGNVV